MKISNAAQIVHLSCNRIENIVGKEENAGYQPFLLFPPCYQNVTHILVYILVVGNFYDKFISLPHNPDF